MTRIRTAPPVCASADICRGCDMCTLSCSLQHAGQCNPMWPDCVSYAMWRSTASASPSASNVKNRLPGCLPHGRRYGTTRGWHCLHRPRSLHPLRRVRDSLPP